MNNEKNKPLIGAHVSYKKDYNFQLLQAIKDLVSIGATSGGFYISNSRGYNKFPSNIENIKSAIEFAKSNNFDIENIIVHSPLVGNISNTNLDQKIFNFTVQSYIYDVKKMFEAGIKYYNFHPGSSPNRKEGIEKCAEGINKIIKETSETNVVLCIETMMKKGNYIGINFEEIKNIIEKVENKDRVGVVIDTCHIWDAGYDLNDVDNVLEEFNKIIGIKYLKGVHVNDSKNDLGSNKDRHENIGKGKIGLENLKKFINHKYIVNLPKVLETPYGKDDFSKWRKEIELLLS